MNKTCAEISRLKQCSRQAVSKFITSNKIQPAGKKGKYPLYDCSKEPLASYLAAGDNKPPRHGPSETPETAAPKPQNTKTAARRILKPLNNLLADKMPPGSKPAEFFYARAAELAKENEDPALYLKLAQIASKEDTDETIRLQAIKTEQAKEQIAQERAERLRIENEIKRGGYMDRATVKTLFGRVYAVHTSVLTPMGLKLSDMINALPQSPDRRNKIQAMVDNEIFSALETIQRLLIEYIRE